MGITERFATALLGSPFGLSGRIRVDSLSGEKNHLLQLQKVTLRKGETEKEYTVEEVFKAPFSLKLEEIDSPEAAKTLKGAEIIIPRELAAPLNEGEFYIEDLRGLRVFFKGKSMGTINGLVEGGGGFLAEILLMSGEKKLVPFRDEFFDCVDPAAGRAELLNDWILE